MDFNMYKVGSINERLIGPEKVVFDFGDQGAVLYVLFANPSEDEIKKVASDIEIRYVKVGSVFMMLFKFGNLQWIDAPYNPHLSNISEITYPENGMGIGLTIIFGDSNTGYVHDLQLIGLETEFSRKFVKDVKEDLEKPFNPSLYQIDVVAVMNSYSTNELVKKSESSCIIRRA